MTDDFDSEAFLDWLDDIDGYRVRASRVREEWPEFEEATGGLIGVTMTYDDGESLVPKRDYRHKVLYGYALD